MLRLNNIIFDWSGTLVDDLEAVRVSTNYALSKEGFPEMTMNQFRSEFSLPFDAFYRRVAPGVTLENIEKWYREKFIKEQKNIRPLPYAELFCNFCRENGIKTFLLSTVNADHYKEQSKKIRFNFDKEYVGVMDKRKKIAAILNDNQLSPEETIFIGDMQHDIETAKIGKIGSCAVLTGYNKRRQLEKARPDLIVDNLGQLKQLIEESDYRWPPR